MIVPTNTKKKTHRLEGDLLTSIQDFFEVYLPLIHILFTARPASSSDL